jgi:hypothetical protein
VTAFAAGFACRYIEMDRFQMFSVPGKMDNISLIVTIETIVSILRRKKWRVKSPRRTNMTNNAGRQVTKVIK